MITLSVSKRNRIIGIILIAFIGILNFLPTHFLIEKHKNLENTSLILELGLALLVISAIVSAIAIYKNLRWGWFLGIVVSVVSIIFWLTQETIGLLDLPKMWFEPSRIVALVIEINFIYLAYKIVYKFIYFQIKKFISTNPIRAIFISIIIIFAIILYPAWILENGNPHEFSMHLFVELLILIATLFLIQPVIDSKKENEWKAAKEGGIQDLKIFTNMLSSYMIFPLGMRAEGYAYSPEELIETPDNAILKMLAAAQEKDITSILKTLDKKRWEIFSLYIIAVRQRIESTVLIYKDHMPNKLLSKLIILRVKFLNIDNDMALFNGTFFYSNNDWEARKEEKESLFTTFCKDFDKELKEYYAVLREFILLRQKYEK